MEEGRRPRAPATLRAGLGLTLQPALSDAVLAWAESEARDLPWRRTRDAWAILVSEFMLQQTQVDRVAPRWTAFLARWPTPAACAAAPVADVVREWAGLGYNRRALHLHRCAQIAVEQHDGHVPRNLDALLSLPGVGAYTARAVLAFAFGHDVAALDTNVARVVRRATGVSGGLQDVADALVPAGRGWAWNQAMMDLGATVCTASRPRCERCPIESICTWPGVDGPSGRRHQPPFERSDRQGRGRLLAALRAGPVRLEAVAAACGWPDDPARAERISARMVQEGFAVSRNGVLALASSVLSF